MLKDTENIVKMGTKTNILWYKQVGAIINV